MKMILSLAFVALSFGPSAHAEVKTPSPLLEPAHGCLQKVGLSIETTLLTQTSRAEPDQRDMYSTFARNVRMRVEKAPAELAEQCEIANNPDLCQVANYHKITKEIQRRYGIPVVTKNIPECVYLELIDFVVKDPKFYIN